MRRVCGTAGLCVGRTPRRDLKARARLMARVAASLAACTIGGGAFAGDTPDPTNGLIVGTDFTVNDTPVPISIRRDGQWEPLTTGPMAWGMAADTGTCTLYIASTGGGLWRYTRRDTAPVRIGTITLAGVATPVPGLAFHNGVLYASLVTGTEGILRIDLTPGPTLGVATRVVSTPSAYDFSGIDIDPGTGTLYGVSDTAPAGVTPGLFTIALDTGAVTLIAAYPTPFPGSGASPDVDGLAVGPGAAYLVVDQPGNVAPYVFATSAYGTQFANPFTLSRTFSSGAFAECFLFEPCVADIDNDGGVTPADVGAFFDLFERGEIDLDEDGGVTPADVEVFFTRFEAGC